MPILFYGVEPFGTLASRLHSRIRFHFEGTVPHNSDKYRSSESPCRQSDIAILRTGNYVSSLASDDWKTMQTCRFSTPGLSGRLKQQGLRLSRSPLFPFCTTFPFCHSNRDSLSLPPLNIWQPPTHARTFPATTPSYWTFRQSASGEAYRSSWDAIRRPDLDSP